MGNQQPGNPLVRAAVRTVLTGGALAAAAFGVANAQQATTSQSDAQQANTQTNAQTDSQQLLAQASTPTLAAAPTTAANAQLQEVVVTGSRIATPNQTSISPVQFVGAKQFQNVGATRVEDVLNRLPQVFASQNSTSINGGSGTETVDLRGLGSQRTLVLVNGQRLPYGDTGGGSSATGADLNMIPTALIENVQILTGGASSIYGPDAVAGVVNFKLLDNFQGVKLVANGGGYFHSNNNDQGVITTINNFNNSGLGFFQPAPSSVATGAAKELTFIAGMNAPDDKGNVTFYASYRNIAKATQNLYSYSACTVASGFEPPKGNGLFSCAGSHTAYPGTFQFFGVGGNPAKSIANTVGAGGAVLPLSAEPEFNFGPLNYYQAPEETWNAGAFLHYTFNEHAQVYASTMFMSNSAQLQIAPGGDFNAPLAVNCDNPYLSTAEVNQWCDGSAAPGTFATQTFPNGATFPNGVTYAPGKGRTLLIGYRNVPGGDRVTNPRHQDWRMVVGTKGAISDNWTYDVSYQYSQVTQQTLTSGDLSKVKMGYALDVVQGKNGPECAVTAAGNTTGQAAGCVPWNIFAPGLVTPAMENYLGVTGVNDGELHQHVIDTNFTGDLSQYVQLPTAHSGLQIAAGTEYIDWNLATYPDVTVQTGDQGGSGGTVAPVHGSIESFSEYVEMRLPILQDKPFAQSLTTDDSIRHSSYALGFATNTYSLGLAWQPVHDVRLRGTFTRAVRAPNITELYSADTVGLDGTQDPCSGATPKYSAAQCANEGVSAAQYGNIISNSAGQYNGLVGGNAQLKPETAITKSFGVSYTPSFLRNFNATIDYYDIKISGIIRGIGANTVVNDCATQDLFCNDIHRDQFGSLWLSTNGYVLDTRQNVGIIEEKGLDVQLNYSLDVGRFGNLSASFTGTHIQNFITTPIAALSSSAYDCAGYYGGTCSAPPQGAPLFTWRHDMQVTWVTPFRSLSVTAGWRYLSGATVDTLNPSPNVGSPGATVANGKVSSTDASLPAFNYLDMSLAYQISDAFLVRFGCNNVMDKSPPVIGTTNGPTTPYYNGNTLPGTYDWGGRYVFGEIDVQF